MKSDANGRPNRGALPRAVFRQGKGTNFLLALLAGLSWVNTLPAAETKPGGGDASISFQATLPGGTPEEKEPPLIYSTTLDSRIQINRAEIRQHTDVTVKRIQGKLKQVVLALGGRGEFVGVQGEGILDWGLRHGTNETRYLVIRLAESFHEQERWSATIESARAIEDMPATLQPFTFYPEDTALFSGLLEISADESLAWDIAAQEGLTPVNVGLHSTNANASPTPGSDQANRKVFRLAGQSYAMRIDIDEADPELRKIRFQNFALEGRVEEGKASFVLRGEVRVNDPRGGRLEALYGDVALTGFQAQDHMRLLLENGRYLFQFATNGVYAVELRFDARISEAAGWKKFGFYPPAAALRPVRLEGFSADTSVELDDAAEARRQDDAYVSHLAASGPLIVRWQEARPTEEGKLFYAVTGASQISVSPGLARQINRFDYKIMQGEIQTLELTVQGEGEVTRVQGNGILTWSVQPPDAEGNRLLVVQLNQTQKDAYALTVQSQTPLGAFPMSFRPLRFVPAGAIRYGGHIRVVNAGAVRLEVLSAPGLAQISPEQFPAVPDDFAFPDQAQVFAFRFSGDSFDMEIQADNVLPEVTLSQLLVYHLGETETSIEAEMELDIREAPLREFEITIPGGYSVAFLNAPHLSDYQTGAPDEDGAARLSVQFGQPLIGRQVVQLRLTRGQAAPETNWNLFPLRPRNVKSVRGFVGASADPGWRLTESQTSGLTEIATAFFPKRLPDLQLSYRLRDADWTATLQAERLAQSIQADSLHLFSVGEGIVYGSSLMNYLVSGAPVSSFQLRVPTNYANLEFVGRDVRNWTQTADGYEVFLHTPVAGAYSLLATYDFQFNPRGEELSFQGIEPLNVQTEQGHLLLVSTYQFRPEVTALSPGLIELEPAEIPTEYRLLYDAPVLAAYQFTGRPFNLQLRLTSLVQGETVNQVVDRATYHTHVSAEGQVLTDASYLVKSKGYSHLRLTVPEEVTLWVVMVNGEKVVPVTDRADTLIPLPQDTPPNSVIPVELKLALKSPRAERVQVALPRLSAPVLLADWQIQPDAGHRLTFQGGDVRPAESAADASGFAWMGRLLGGEWGGDQEMLFWCFFVLLLLGAWLWRWATQEGMFRYCLRNLAGGVLGAAALALAGLILAQLTWFAAGHPLAPGSNLVFSMPVQAPDHAVAVTVRNHDLSGIWWGWLAAWPVALGLLAWAWLFVTAQTGLKRLAGVALGWVLILWGTLRCSNSAGVFFILLGLFALIHVIIPLARRQTQLPRKPKPEREPAPNNEPEPDPDSGPSPASGGATALLLLSALLLGPGANARAAATEEERPVVVESIVQQARVNDDRVRVEATLTWPALAGQTLDFLRAPAVLTEIQYDREALRLVEESTGKTTVHRLVAQRSGEQEIVFQYEVPVQSRDGARGFHLPTHHGLINRLTLFLDRGDVEMVVPRAVSIDPVALSPDPDTTSRRVELVLAPETGAWVAWKPRTRDIRAEETVFYGELFHLFVPTAGIVEGLHEIQIRPAQGQVRELVLETPANLTITDVQASGMASWKFDPDNRRVRVLLEPPASTAFTVKLYSQITTGPLPFEHEIGLIALEGAAGQIHMIGVATGSEVQLEDAAPSGLTQINLEDFPAALIQVRAEEIPGLTLRRAFRTSEAGAGLQISAAAVEPDVRVAAQQTLSLGEDRTVLAVDLAATITRAGVFKLSFVLPAGFDVESITGEAMSHWTELRTGEERAITMHLKGKTEGQRTFAIHLTGQGVPAGAGWSVPRLVLREATKQTGRMIVVPEQGMRLTVATRDGLTQLDPQEAGIRQKGVMVFRLLQPDWQLAFDIEKVDPWIQVVSLQDVTVREGQFKVVATFDYKIENAGLKSLFVLVSTNADGVRFSGAQVTDAVRSETSVDGMAEWEVKLDRRIIGAYRLQVHYQVPETDPDGRAVVASVRVRQVNLHRAYLTLRTGGRLQMGIPSLPAALQSVDWRSLPASLRGGQSANEGNFTFRALEPEFALALNVVRHDAARLLPARIEQTDLSTMVSASGQMLTQVRLSLRTGDKSTLRLRVPEGARFWFAFVNNTGVWPWRENDEILIPLEQNFKPGPTAVVEFLYSLPSSDTGGRVKDFGLVGPELDLPLENITWNVYLPPHHELKDWEGELQLQQESVAKTPVRLDLQSYLQRESGQQAEQTREAESMLRLANDFLAKGEQGEARKAFQSAWSLSQHDEAFNEDARVQLHNVKMQQALVGLNYRRNALFQDGATAALGGSGTNAALNILQANQPPQFTQQQVQQALEVNSAEDNTALMKLAEHLIQQQDAAQAAPEAIRATLPQQGPKIVFTRSLLVDTFAPLRLKLETEFMGGSTWAGRFGGLMALLAGLVVFMILGRRHKMA